MHWHDSAVGVQLGPILNPLGEGNGTPLQSSCLENPMDRGTWWAAVHGVAKSWTRLRDFTFTFHSHALEKEMATHSSILAWRIPGMRQPDGLPSLGLHRGRQRKKRLSSSSRTPFTPPSPSPSPRSSQWTSPGHPVSCIGPGMVIYFTDDNIHISMLFSQITPPSPFPTSPKVCSVHLCLFCCLTYRVIITIFLNSTYMC